MTNSKIISSKTIIKSPYLEFKEEQVQLANSVVDTHHNLYRNPVVMIFPLTDKYEVYLISEYRYLHAKRMLGAVAGHVDEGESSLAAAKRELLEEVGITADQWEEVLRTELAGSIIKSTVHIFLARGLSIGKHHREVGEDIELVKMSLKEAIEKVINGEIQNASTIAGLFVLDKLKREKKI